MSGLIPAQFLSRKDLELINNALDVYYMSDALPETSETDVVVLKDKISNVRFSDFEICVIETM